MKNVIFNKRFFRLNCRDQVAVIEAALRDIEKNYGRFLDRNDERRARRRAQRIRKKAVRYGVLRGGQEEGEEDGNTEQS